MLPFSSRTVNASQHISKLVLITEIITNESIYQTKKYLFNYINNRVYRVLKHDKDQKFRYVLGVKHQPH